MTNPWPLAFLFCLLWKTKSINERQRIERKELDIRDLRKKKDMDRGRTKRETKNLETERTRERTQG